MITSKHNPVMCKICTVLYDLEDWWCRSYGYKRSHTISAFVVSCGYVPRHVHDAEMVQIHVDMMNSLGVSIPDGQVESMVWRNHDASLDEVI